MNLNNKICIVTGANSGIGKVTARKLAAAGATVVMLCRNEAKGLQALNDLKRETGNKRTNLILADLSSLDSLRNFVEQFRAQFPRLDILINNAGLCLPERQQNLQGHEMMFAINHIGSFALTCLLSDSLQNARRARIITVASMAHWLGSVQPDNLQAQKRFNPFLQYCNTKLCNILFSQELARRAALHNIASFSLHPGVIRTGFAQDEPGWFGSLVKFGHPLMSSPEKGALTSLYLATATGIHRYSGRYFANSKPAFCSPTARSASKARALWNQSVDLTGVDWL